MADKRSTLPIELESDAAVEIVTRHLLDVMDDFLLALQADGAPKPLMGWYRSCLYRFIFWYLTGVINRVPADELRKYLRDHKTEMSSAGS